MLTKLAAIDPDDLPVRKKLAQLALAQSRLAGRRPLVAGSVAHSGRRRRTCTAVGPKRSGQGDARAAADEYAAAVELDPERLALRLALAETLVKANEPDKARRCSKSS